MAFKELYNLANKLKALKENQLLKEVLDDKQLQAQIIDLITESQMYNLGVDGKGETLGEYAPVTISFYKPRAASIGNDGRTDHVTLKDTGEFYASFRVASTNEGLVVKAETDKGDNDLIDIYPNLLGLTDASKAEILPEIRQSILELIREQIKR
jgi:hypothetical protein